jgi:hypothetical protein
MRRSIIVLLFLAAAVLVRKACRRALRCGCIEGCTCRDRATYRCKETAGTPVAAA